MSILLYYMSSSKKIKPPAKVKLQHKEEITQLAKNLICFACEKKQHYQLAFQMKYRNNSQYHMSFRDWRLKESIKKNYQNLVSCSPQKSMELIINQNGTQNSKEKQKEGQSMSEKEIKSLNTGLCRIFIRCLDERKTDEQIQAIKLPIYVAREIARSRLKKAPQSELGQQHFKDPKKKQIQYVQFLDKDIKILKILGNKFCKKEIISCQKEEKENQICQTIYQQLIEYLVKRTFKRKQFQVEKGKNNICVEEILRQWSQKNIGIYQQVQKVTEDTITIFCSIIILQFLYKDFFSRIRFSKDQIKLIYEKEILEQFIQFIFNKIYTKQKEQDSLKQSSFEEAINHYEENIEIICKKYMNQFKKDKQQILNLLKSYSADTDSKPQEMLEQSDGKHEDLTLNNIINPENFIQTSRVVFQEKEEQVDADLIFVSQFIESIQEQQSQNYSEYGDSLQQGIFMKKSRQQANRR